MSMMLSLGQYFAASVAAFAAGVINAVAGGGTLVSFPTLVALGVPALSANITNTVALSPGYLGGTLAQRTDLMIHRRRLRALLIIAGLGGLLGSLLLVFTSEILFRGMVPFLILFACVLLGFQDLIKQRPLNAHLSSKSSPHSWALLITLFLASIYGGYFGAGLGIMLLAILGLTLNEKLTELNALKQVLSLVINLVAALFFAFSGKVYWGLAAVMALASLLGGNLGGRIVTRLNPRVLRAIVVALGVAVAVKFMV